MADDNDNKTTQTQTEVKREPQIEPGKLKRNEDTTNIRTTYEKKDG